MRNLFFLGTFNVRIPFQNFLTEHIFLYLYFYNMYFYFCTFLHPLFYTCSLAVSYILHSSILHFDFYNSFNADFYNCSSLICTYKTYLYYKNFCTFFCLIRVSIFYILLLSACTNFTIFENIWKVRICSNQKCF